MDTLTIKYIFDVGTPEAKTFRLEFDALSMNYKLPKEATLTSWASLESQKCTHCPLSLDEYKHCPIALGLFHVTNTFAEEKSYRESNVMVVTEQRSYVKKVPLQDGLFGIFGLIMATSGCPHFDFLKPMARLHLPFSSAEETITRSLSMFLLKKFYQSNDTNSPMNFDLEEFNLNYQNVNIANQGIVERIRLISKGDASRNAVICLDNFCLLLSMDLNDKFQDIRGYLGM